MKLPNKAISVVIKTESVRPTHPFRLLVISGWWLVILEGGDCRASLAMTEGISNIEQGTPNVEVRFFGFASE